MANTVQIKRGSNASVNAHTGPSGELIYNLDTGRLHAQDGSTAGGNPHALVSDVDLKANAATQVIAGGGLTGGGDLSANRTVNVGEGTGISVAADAVSLNSASIASLGKADTALQAPGGTTGQILAKSSNTTNDVAWVSNEAATAVSYGPQTLTELQQVQARQNIQADKSYDSIASVASATVPTFANAIRTNGYYAAGDGGGGLYERVTTPDPIIHHFQSTDGANWQWVDEGKTSETIHFRRRVAVELPWYNDDLKYFETLYGHSLLYPQAFHVDTADNLAYVLYAPVAPIGSNNHPVITVYDISGGNPTAPLTTFALNGGRWYEGMVVYREGASRFLVTSHGTLARYNITSLPANRSAIAPNSSGTVVTQSFLAWTGDKFFAQFGEYDGLPLIHRSQFAWFDNDFNYVSSVRLPSDVTATLDTAYVDHLPKAQGIAVIGDRVFVGTGGDAVPATKDTSLPRYQQGLVEVDANGNLVRRSLVDPDAFRAKLEPVLGWLPDMIENEGLGASDGRLFSLWCCTHPNNRDTTGRTRGIVITEEMSMSPDALDCSDIEYVWDRPQDMNSYARNTWMKITHAPVDPILETPINSFASVLNFMRAMAVPRLQMSFISGHPLAAFKDINGADVATAGYWEFFFYAGSAFIEKTSIDGKTAWGISGVGTGAYAQTIVDGSMVSDVYRFGTTSNNPAFAGEAGAVIGKAGYLSANRAGVSCYLGRNTDGNIVQFYLGDSSIRGSIGVTGSGVSFNQTSDATQKIDDGDLSFEESCAIISLCQIHNFTWKDSGIADVGVFAQELYNIYPRAVMKGGWFMPDDDTAEVPEGTECAVYRPWQVNYMALMPIMMRVVQGLLAQSSTSV